MIAGFTGPWNAGSIAISPAAPGSRSDFDPESAVVFGLGASGLGGSRSAFRFEDAKVFVSITVGVVGEELPETVLQQNNKSAVRTNVHLSHCRPGEGSGENCNCMNFTGHPYRCHWPNGPAFGSTDLPAFLCSPPASQELL